MANIKADEMALLKATSIKLDDDTMFVITLQYHTEKGDRSKSRYRWLGRVMKVADVKAKVDALNASFKEDANAKLAPWVWPNDPSWNGKIIYTESDALHASKWLRSKVNKLVDWDTGVKLLNGWDKKKGEYFTAKKYETEGFSTEDGTEISILDKDALLARVGQNVWKEMTKKAKAAPAQGQPNENAVQPNETVAAQPSEPVAQPSENPSDSLEEAPVAIPA